MTLGDSPDSVAGPVDVSDEKVRRPDAAAPFEPLVVSRSALRIWLMSLAGIPAIVVGIDFVWRKRIVGWLTERIFSGDPQTLEARDEIWAWTLIVVGVALVGWGLKELFVPSAVVRTDVDGVHLNARGPFRPSIVVPWDRLADVYAGTIRDDGEPVDVLVIEVTDPALLPLDPWAGRRYDETTLALFSTEWDQSATAVAHTISEQALAVAGHEPYSP